MDLQPVDTAPLVVYRRIAKPLHTVAVQTYIQSAPTDISGSGSIYVVLVQGQNGWPSDSYHSVSHPTLFLNIYADASRNEWGDVTADDAGSKATAVFEYVDKQLNNKTNLHWPEVISCRRPDEPSYIPVPEDDHAVLISARYEIGLR